MFMTFRETLLATHVAGALMLALHPFGEHAFSMQMELIRNSELSSFTARTKVHLGPTEIAFYSLIAGALKT